MTKCIHCAEATYVVETRTTRKKYPGYLFRRRECASCERRFNTLEIPLEHFENMLELIEAVERLTRILDKQKEPERRPPGSFALR